MVNGTQEKDLVQHIEHYLCRNGYQGLAPQDYDRTLGLVSVEVLVFIRATQPRGYAALQVLHGSKTDEQLLLRLAQQSRSTQAAARGLNINPKRIYQSQIAVQTLVAAS